MLFSTFSLNLNKGLTMIPSLSRFGASLPAYSTRPAFTPTTENSKALGVSSRANTQRQGFSIFTLATMAYATGKKQYEVGMQDPKIGDALNRIVSNYTARGVTGLYSVNPDKLREIEPFLKKHFESVFLNTDNPLTVLQGWLIGKGEKPTAPVEEETLGAYIEDCEFYADLLGDKNRLDRWEGVMTAKVQNCVLTTTEQRRWDSYLTYKKLELISLQSPDLRSARQRGFKNLKRTLEALLEPSS
jgi:hypothetical protein